MSTTTSLTRSATQALAEAASEVHSESRRMQEQFVRQHLESSEKLFGFQMGQQRMPFLMRILPLMPDLLTRPKHFALAVTNHRLLIVRLKQGLYKFKGSVAAASIPLDDFAEFATRGSSVIVKTRSGKNFKYSSLSTSDVRSLQGSVARARQTGV